MGVAAERGRGVRWCYLRAKRRSTCVMRNVPNGECRTVYYCWSCGTQPFRGPHVPRDPDATAARIHVGKLEARWAVVFAAMAERPGQRPKSKIADDFDAFLLARSGRGRGWTTATDDDVFDWACFVDSQGHGATWVHDRSCPGVGLADGAHARRVAIAPSGMRLDRWINRIFRSWAWPCGNNLAR